MNKFNCSLFLIIVVTFTATQVFSQEIIEAGDPPNPKNIPAFFKSKLSDVQSEIEEVNKGDVKIIAVSPGGLPVYAVYYGDKDDFHPQANYNSAVAARNPAYYARKDSTTKPVLFFIGPVHGQEIENIVGLVNLIHIAETGKDYRGRDWTSLQKKIEKCRTIIIPCANPDGRKRCPYDTFLGLPTETMTKYGQGTRKDGSFYGWPGAKAIHPMKGDIGILGAYFNDNGINIMQDEYFKPMAKETEAILEIARAEAPDISVSLHSHENHPIILHPSHVPMFMKNRVHNLAINVNNRYKEAGIDYADKYFWEPHNDNMTANFNLISALHHISGTMSFTFECSHGSISETETKPLVDYNDILYIELLLFDEMYDYILKNRIYWK